MILGLSQFVTSYTSSSYRSKFCLFTKLHGTNYRVRRDSMGDLSMMDITSVNSYRTSSSPRINQEFKLEFIYE